MDVEMQAGYPIESPHPLLPDAPTFRELGIDWVDGAYRGIGVPKSTPADVKKRIDGAMVMQGHQYTAGRRLDLTIDIETMHHCRQPIVVTNPGSGRKGLYVTSQNTMWIEGMDRAESEALLTTMFDIAEDPAIIYEHVWRVGDLVMWDNLACLHARTDWPGDQRRTLRRCTIEGEPLY